MKGSMIWRLGEEELDVYELPGWDLPGARKKKKKSVDRPGGLSHNT